MRLLLALWALAMPPKLGTPIAIPMQGGGWKCSAMCLTSGNDDGGSCRTPLVTTGPTEAACIQSLHAQCAKTKPPPGGCRWDGQPAAGK